MTDAGRQLGSQERNAVVVNRHWRDRIDNDVERMRWLRGVIMHHLQESRGIIVMNVRLNNGFWEFCVDGSWFRVTGDPSSSRWQPMISYYDQHSESWQYMTPQGDIIGPQMTATEIMWRRGEIPERVYLGVDMASGPDKTVINGEIVK